MPPERWLALTVSLPEGPGGELLPHALLALGGGGVEEREGVLTTFLPPPPDLEAFLREARASLEAATGISGLALGLAWRWQPHEDWASLWRRGLGPRRITPRLVVAPSWDAPPPGPGEVVLTLDPGMAFGTAEHATTRGCLRLMDPFLSPGIRVADVGTGSGILAIAAALLGAREVVAVEADPLACEVALENVAANGVRDRVRILCREVDGEGTLPGAPFDGIVANLQSGLLLPLLHALRESLAPGGWLVLGGILLEEREALLAASHGAHLRPGREDREGEWWSALFRRPGPA